MFSDVADQHAEDVTHVTCGEVALITIWHTQYGPREPDLAVASMWLSELGAYTTTVSHHILFA